MAINDAIKRIFDERKEMQEKLKYNNNILQYNSSSN